VPNYPVMLWDTFHSEAFEASLINNATYRDFNIKQSNVSTKNTTVKLFLRTKDQINNQKLLRQPNTKR
jgi:hypothetical protein